MINEQNFSAEFYRAEKLYKDSDLTNSYQIYLALLKYIVHSETATKQDYNLVIFERLSDITQLKGDFATTERLLVDLMLLYQLHHKVYYYFHTILKIGHLLAENGSLEKAYCFLEEHLRPYIGTLNNIPFSKTNVLKEWEEVSLILQLTPQEKSLFLSRLYFVLSTLLSYLGQYDDAISAGKQILRHINQNKIDVFLFKVKLEYARIILEKGRITDAQILVDELREIIKEQEIPPQNYINFLSTKARISMLTGAYGETLECFAEIISISQKYSFTNAIITTKLNLAEFQVLLNQINEATIHLTEVEELINISGLTKFSERVSNLKMLSTLRSQSPLGLTNSVYNTKENHFKEITVVSNVKQKANYLVWYELRALVFQVYLAQQNFNKARQYLEYMKQTFLVSDSKLIKIRLAILDFMCMYYERKVLPTFNYTQIITFLKKQCLLPELWQFQRILTWTILLKETTRYQLIDTNKEVLHKIMNSLPVEAKGIFMLNKWTSDEAYLTSKIILLQQLKFSKYRWLKPFRYWKLLKGINLLIEHIDQYKSFIANNTLRGSSLSFTNEISLNSNILWRLLKHPIDRVSISFLLLPDRLLIYYTSFLGVGFKVIYVSRIEIRNRISEILSLIVSSKVARGLGRRDITTKNRQNRLNSLLEDFKSIICFEEILNKFSRRVKRLTIIPDDSFHGFPFALLKIDNRFLIERFALSYAYENNFSVKKQRKSNARMLLVGISKFNHFSNLTGVEKEITHLEQATRLIATERRVLKNKSVSKRNFLAAVADTTYLHIATHGKFEHNNPANTGIILWDDEPLTLREIAEELDCKNLLHVTLSSCQGADNFVLPGRWVISLPETFWRKGTQSILGCLWEVDDAFAVEFNALFYKKLAELPRDLALQQTQLFFLQNQNKYVNYRPELWAGFQLYGSWKTLPIKKIK